MVGAFADLLVGGECDAQPPVGAVFGNEPFTQRHDLGDPRFVVRPQQGGAIGGDEGLALEPGQPGETGGGDHPSLPGQDDIAAVIVFVHNGVDVFPGKGGGGVHVGQEAQGGDVLQPLGCGEPGGNDAIAVHAWAFQPQLFQLLHQQAGQIPLAGGGGGGPRLRGGGGVDFDVLQKAFIGFHFDNFLSSLRPTR